METFIILIGILFAGPNTQVDILQVYANQKTCVVVAEKFNKKAREEQTPYRFVCRPVNLTRA